MTDPFSQEFFGSAAQIALQRRAAALYHLIGKDPDYCFYGRLVGLNTPRGDVTSRLADLARVQGAAACYYFPKERAAELFAGLEAQGLATDRHEHFYGTKGVASAARRILDETQLPQDVKLVRIGPETPAELVADLAALSIECGVTPVPGPAYRGLTGGISFAAVDQAGGVVATSTSLKLHHPQSPRAGDVFWGMLATAPERRGQKLALVLGAMAILDMAEKGATGFITGVRSDNSASAALCGKLGLGPSGWIFAQCIDREGSGLDRLTK